MVTKLQRSPRKSEVELHAGRAAPPPLKFWRRRRRKCKKGAPPPKLNQRAAGFFGQNVRSDRLHRERAFAIVKVEAAQ